MNILIHFLITVGISYVSLCIGVWLGRRSGARAARILIEEGLAKCSHGPAEGYYFNEVEATKQRDARLQNLIPK